MESLVVKYSQRSKNIYHTIAIICFICASIAGYLLFIYGNETSIGIFFFWSLSTSIILVFTASMSVMTISDKGLKCIGLRPIPWDQIEAVWIGSILWSTKLFIKFRNPRRLRYKRPILLIWGLFFGGEKDDLFLTLDGLELKPEEIYSIITKHLEIVRES